MPFDARVLTVLIASPGDVRAERDVIERELHDWNSSYSTTRNVTLQPRRWETDGVPLLAHGDRQSVLNEQIVDGADIVIGIFHTRLGSPTTRAPSGTAEELARTAAAGKPVHVWFSKRPLPYEFDEDQFRALRAFRTALESENFVGTFTSEDELRTKVRRALDDDVTRFSTVEDDGEHMREPPPPDQVQAGQPALEELLELPLAGGRLPRIRDVDPYSLGVVGPSKAGKSRTAYEAAVRVLGDARLVVPRVQTRALPTLASNELIVEEPDAVVSGLATTAASSMTTSGGSWKPVDR